MAGIYHKKEDFTHKIINQRKIFNEMQANKKRKAEKLSIMGQKLQSKRHSSVLDDQPKDTIEIMVISPKFSNNEIKENNIEENKDKCDDLILNH